MLLLQRLSKRYINSMAEAVQLPAGHQWWNGGKSPFNLEYGKVMMWYFLLSDAFTFGAFLISYGTIRFSSDFWPDPNVVFNAVPFAGHANLPLVFVSIMTFILIVSSVTMVLAVRAGHFNDKKSVINYMWWTIIGGIAFLACQAWEWTHLLTGEHISILKDGSLGVVPMTVTQNPWGDAVDLNAVNAALANTSKASLVELAGLGHHGAHHVSHEALSNMSQAQLVEQIRANGTLDHVTKTGAVAFGGYFYGITGFHGFHVLSGVVINIVMLIMTYQGVFERKGHYNMIEKAGLYWHFVDLVWVFVFLCFYLI
jgi:cytochrome c oxidase subunit III